MLKVRKPITNGQLSSFGEARCCHAATSERGHGWVGCLPLNYNARSEASEHAFARVAIPRHDPLHLLTHFGALLPNHFCSNTISNRTASTVSCDNRFLLQKKKARLHLVKGRSYLAVPPFFVSFLTLFVA